MTTAPTPSDAERLARGLEEGFCGHAAWLQPAAAELRRLQAENECLRADQGQAMSEASSLAMSLFQKHYSSDPDYASGAVKFGLCDDLRGVISQIDNMSTGLARAELEACKPLPLSIERLDELWASQRRFHGGEPLKMGHVEFARLIEVEYGVLGRIPMREENGGQIDHSLIASREVVADGAVRVTRLKLTEEGRAGLTSKATGPLTGITGGSS
ncbi:hypothetical protein [Delftia sp. HK171]|uniref:hypothetical protein n=1 Tax=Delftia sp. HK171 TaxID=1920191 RepID=UPI0011505CE1|nr:hypothetical protein [Delftia sp. HK171]TQL83118.1 hypothetical protein FB549_0605 [Delftia sp. HK171]